VSKLFGSILAPFAKITGAVPSARIPAGYEAVKTGTETSYETGGGRESEVTRITEAQYDKLLQGAGPDLSAYGDFGRGGGAGGGASRASIERQYRRRDEDIYEILPINRNQAAAPAPVVAPSPTPTPVAPVVAAPSLSPPSGGVQPTQPAQPVTPATATVPKIMPAQPVSSQVAQAGVGGAAAPKRPGRRAFVRTSPLGLTAQAVTKKKRLGA